MEAVMAFNPSYLLTQTLGVRSWAKEIAIVLSASVLIALFAPISIPLPFTPVPLATQPQVILFLAALLGSKRGSLAVLTYLFQGCIGLPVFAGGAAGVLCLAGPSGGYLIGYLAAAYVTGLLVERIRERTTMNTFLAMAVGNGVIFVFGVAWLSHFTGIKAAFLLGVFPFLIGDFLKLVIAVRGLKAIRFFQ
jgi:biotin transport system substrate-specific component